MYFFLSAFCDFKNLDQDKPRVIFSQLFEIYFILCILQMKKVGLGMNIFLI